MIDETEQGVAVQPDVVMLTGIGVGNGQGSGLLVKLINDREKTRFKVRIFRLTCFIGGASLKAADLLGIAAAYLDI